MSLPIPVRAEAVKTENESDFLTRLKIAGVIEEVRPASLHLDDGSWVDNPFAGTVLVRTMKNGRGGTGGSPELNGFFLTGIRKRNDYDEQGWQSNQIE
jgi:hypothetical protein